MLVNNTHILTCIWAERNNNVDCGVYVMRHIDHIHERWIRKMEAMTFHEDRQPNLNALMSQVLWSYMRGKLYKLMYREEIGQQQMNFIDKL